MSISKGVVHINNCSEYAKRKITAYAADYLGKQTKADIEIMRELIKGVKSEDALTSHALAFWNLVTEAHNSCDTEYHPLVKKEISRILDKLHEKAIK